MKSAVAEGLACVQKLFLHPGLAFGKVLSHAATFGADGTLRTRGKSREFAGLQRHSCADWERVSRSSDAPLLRKRDPGRVEGSC